MANKVRGDYELDDLAVELVKKLSSLRSQIALPSFDVELRGLLNEGQFETLWTRMVDASPLFFLGDHRDTPDAFNVLFELLDTIDSRDPEQQELSASLARQLVQRMTNPKDALMEQVSSKHKAAGKIEAQIAGHFKQQGQADTSLVVLANLYNATFIAEDSHQALRFEVLRSLVEYAAAQNKVPSVGAFLENSAGLLETIASAPIADQRQTLLTIYEAVHAGFAAGEATALEQTYLIEYLKTFNAASQHASIDLGVQSLACSAIAASVGNVLAANGRILPNLAAVKTLATAGGSKAQLLSLLTIFNDGLLADYVVFHRDHPEVLTEFGIDHQQALRSMRLLSLCTACAGGKDGKITYAVAAESMGLEAADEEALTAKVEEWAMLAIKNGLVDVKMCQQTKSIIVYATTQRSFQVEQWKGMVKKITRWKTQINKLLVTVKNIRLTQQGRAQALR